MSFKHYKILIVKSIILAKNMINLGSTDNLSTVILKYLKDNGISLNMNRKNRQILEYLVGIAYEIKDIIDIKEQEFTVNASLVYIGF